MIGVVLAHIFDAKVVNDEKKNDVFGGVFPKIRSERDGGRIQTWRDADGGGHLKCAWPVSGLAFLCRFPYKPIRWSPGREDCTGG